MFVVFVSKTVDYFDDERARLAVIGAFDRARARAGQKRHLVSVQVSFIYTFM